MTAAFGDTRDGHTACHLCGHVVRRPTVRRTKGVWRGAARGVLHSAQTRHLDAKHPGTWRWEDTKQHVATRRIVLIDNLPATPSSETV